MKSVVVLLMAAIVLCGSYAIAQSELPTCVPKGRKDPNGCHVRVNGVCWFDVEALEKEKLSNPSNHNPIPIKAEAESMAFCTLQEDDKHKFVIMPFSLADCESGATIQPVQGDHPFHGKAATKPDKVQKTGLADQGYAGLCYNMLLHRNNNIDVDPHIIITGGTRLPKRRHKHRDKDKANDKARQSSDSSY